MSFLFVTPTYRPSFFSDKRRGGEISNFILMSGLAKKGHQVYVISMFDVTGKNVYRDEGIIVVELGLSYLGRRLSNMFSILFFNFLLKNLVFRIKPKVILGSTSTIKSASKVAKHYRIPTGGIVRAMENLPGYGWSINKTSLKSIFKYVIHKLTIGWPGENELESVDFIIANSEFLKSKYLNVFPNKKIYVVYPLLSTCNAFSTYPSQISKIMMVGKTEDKGYSIFERLASKFNTLEFHVMGALPGSSVEVMTKKNLYLHGWINNPIEFIDNMDLVLVPSQWEEPFGRISLEALSRKKFVLVSDRGGLPETVNDERLLVVSFCDLHSWEERINQLINDRVSFEGAMNRACKATSKFELNTQINNMEDILVNNCIK